MADRSAIEWTDATWNPIVARGNHPRVVGKLVQEFGWHCEHVSEGCRNCFAEAINRRLGTGLDYKPGHLRGQVSIELHEERLLQPLRWKRPRLIFVCSMTDLFADFVPDEFIDRMFAVMALCPQHTFQVLTKRPERMRAYISRSCGTAGTGGLARRCLDMAIARQARITADWPVDSIGHIDEPDDVVLRQWPLPNVWLGTSVEDQAAAAARIPDLLATPAAVRFLSCEPLLGPVDLERVDLSIVEARAGEPSGLAYVDALSGLHVDAEGAVPGVHGDPDPKIDWVIVGGESGPTARPMHPEWARELRDQCALAGVPFTFKQWGEWAPGECATKPQTRTERVAWLEAVDPARWHFEELTVSVSEGLHREDGPDVWRFGKKGAGRLLDGVQHDGRPA